MTKLSVNINKIATLRNARGGNVPDVVAVALAIEKFGADGITVHPRPDERHIRYNDVRELKKVLIKELNVEGFPDDRFMELVLEVCPAQVTLVPDPPGVLTSNAGWDTIREQKRLAAIIAVLSKAGIRTSIFVEPSVSIIEAAKDTGTDRIELYTESYASNFTTEREKALAPYMLAAEKARELQIGINAGHDLSLINLNYFKKNIPELMEVSIGHALITDALTYGLENTVRMYQRELHKT